MVLQHSTSRLLHSIAVTLHYIYLRYFNRLVHHNTIHCIKVRYSTICNTYYITVHCVTVQHITFITFHCSNTTLHLLTLLKSFSTSHHNTIHCITVRYSTICNTYYITVHYVTVLHITLFPFYCSNTTHVYIYFTLL